jgi:hypothetical protein
MNKQVKKEVKKNKRKIAAWWWSIGAVLTLATLVTCTIALPATSFTSSSTSTSLASSSVSNQNNQITLIEVEVSKNPIRTVYSPVDVISTSGGELRLVYSDYSVKYIPIKDEMIDSNKLNLSSLGITKVNLVYLSEGKSFSASYDINVIAYEIKLENLSLDINQTTIVQGQSVKLNLNLQPINADLRFTTWESSNNSIVSVDNEGIITANSVGEAIISVYANGLSARSTVNVIKNMEVLQTRNFRNSSELDNLIESGFIPIANATELNEIRLVTTSFTASYNNKTYVFDDYNIVEGQNLNALKRKYVLVNDINFSNSQFDGKGANVNGWNPIGNAINPFTGEFNGNDKTINDLYILRDNEDNVGLFGYVSSDNLEDPVIYNLTLNNPSVEGNANVGAVVGFLNNAFIENITVDTENTTSLEQYLILNQEFITPNNSEQLPNPFGSNIVSGITRVGGVVGRNYDGKINQASNRVTVLSIGLYSDSRSGFIGGIVGGSTLSNSDPNLAKKAEISNVTNYGLVISMERNFVGGIVGGSGLYLQPYNENLKVTNATNYGDIVTYDLSLTLISEDPDVYENGQAETVIGIGGIAGANGGLISNVTNYGQIGVSMSQFETLLQVLEVDGFPGNPENGYFDFNGTSVGGIAGFNFFGAIINNSTNRNDVYGTSFVGGLVGNNSGVIYLSRTVNEPNIDENIKKVSGFYQVGGLVGLELNFMNGETIDNSTNDFEVFGLYGVGGIVGSGLGSNLFRVANFADVSGVYGVGGIAGTSEYLTLREGYNSGNIGIVDQSYYLVQGEPIDGPIISIENFGGLIGSADEPFVETSFNLGDVSGPINVGGLIGVVEYDIKLIESINIGSVTLINNGQGISSVGNLIGNIFNLNTGENLPFNGIVANLSLDNAILAIGSDTSSDLVNGFFIKELTSESDLALPSTYSFTLDNPELDYNYKWNIDNSSYQVWQIDDQAEVPLMPKWSLAPPTERFIYPNYQYLLSFVKGISAADDFSNNTDTFDINLVKDISNNITSIDYVITITDDQEFSIYSESTDDAIFRNNDIQYIMLERATFAAASGSPKLYALNDSQYISYLDNYVIHADAVLIEKSTTLDYDDFAIQRSSVSNDFSIFVIPSNTPKAAYVIRLEPDSELTSTQYANIAPYAETIHVAVRNFVPFFHD